MGATTLHMRGTGHNEAWCSSATDSALNRVHNVWVPIVCVRVWHTHTHVDDSDDTVDRCHDVPGMGTSAWDWSIHPPHRQSTTCRALPTEVIYYLLGQGTVVCARWRYDQ